MTSVCNNEMTVNYQRVWCSPGNGKDYWNRMVWSMVIPFSTLPCNPLDLTDKSFCYCVPRSQSNQWGYVPPACPLQLQLKGSSKASVLFSLQPLWLQEGSMLVTWLCCLLLRGSSSCVMCRYPSIYPHTWRNSLRGERREFSPTGPQEITSLRYTQTSAMPVLWTEGCTR